MQSFRYFVIFKLYDPTLLVNFDQDSGNLMKNLKNFDQKTSEKFERFILVEILVENLKDFNQSSGHLMENLRNFDRNTIEKFERFRSEFWW